MFIFYVFIFGLFKDAASHSEYIPPNDRAISELEGKCEELVVA
jgi:hypothetical protein